MELMMIKRFALGGGLCILFFLSLYRQAKAQMPKG